MKKIIVGTRGSALATRQTEQTIKALKKQNPGCEFELKIIETSGDKDQSTELHKFDHLGVFVKELQIALMEGSIDCAIHSLKDVPDQSPPQLVLCSFPLRENAADVWISNGPSFWDLPAGATVGTGSPRRMMQLKKRRPQINFKPLRGNLDTRIKKALDGELDGIVLAAAGLNRLGWQKHIGHYFGIDQMIPAIGQGVVVIECRQEDQETQEICKSISDPLTEAAALMEREFMVRLGGGCRVPMACHAYTTGQEWVMSATLGHPDTLKSFVVKSSGAIHQVESVVESLIAQTTQACREQNIPLPKDLPQHHLLQNHFKK